jgi:hypothetical protein
MRASFLAVFVMGFGGLLFAQLQLAPNPACPSSAPFCRFEVSSVGGATPGVMGAYNGVLYGYIRVEAGNACPSSSAPPDPNNASLCFYSSTTFSPENWIFQGRYLTARTFDFPVEIVFGPSTCSSYKYIYTTNHRILRASTANWNFTDIVPSQPQIGIYGLPNLPPDTAGRPGSFAIANLGSLARLFYGNYNDHSYNGNNPPYGAYVWHSDNCGNSWTSQFLGGREVHAINVDPADNSDIYVTVDNECSPDGSICPGPASLGVWRSGDSGDNFFHVSNSNGNPINFVLPRVSNNLFLETDGGLAATTGGPLLSWDKANGGDIQIAAHWPSASPAWAGSGLGIDLTSEQNIFVQSNGEGGVLSNLYGLWYFAPPFYDVPVLLENLPSSVILFPNRTVEVTDPSTHISYLYSNDQRMVKPQFINAPLPAAGSALTSFVDTNGGQHWVYLGANQHLYQIFWKPGSGIGFTDLIAAAGGPVAASGSALSSYIDNGGTPHCIYLGTNQHIYQILFGSDGTFGSGDITAGSGAPVAAAGSALNSYTDSNGAQHWVFLGADNHVYQAIWIPNVGSGFQDLTVLGGATLAASGSALTSYEDQSYAQHWLYFDSNQHINQVIWVPGSGFGAQDLTAAAGAPAAAAGSPLTSFVDSSGGQHWVYLGPDHHVYQAVWISGFGYEDRTVVTGAPLAAATSGLSILLDPIGGQHFIYQGTDQHVYQAFWIPNSGFGYEDRTVVSHAPVAASGSALNSFVDAIGGQHFIYLGTNQHIYNANWIPNSGFGFTDLNPR